MEATQPQNAMACLYAMSGHAAGNVHAVLRQAAPDLNPEAHRQLANCPPFSVVFFITIPTKREHFYTARPK
jgi:hypothetical protein